MRLQDWLHSGDEFSIAFKVNYISEDLLPVMVTSGRYVNSIHSYLFDMHKQRSRSRLTFNIIIKCSRNLLKLACNVQSEISRYHLCKKINDC